GVRVELARARAGEAGLVAGVLDDHALQAEAQAERGDLVVTGELERSELAFDPADAESTWNADSIEVAERFRCAFGGLALVRGDPLQLDLGLMGESAGAQCLGDREVGIRKIDVLADETDGDLVLGLVHGL